MLLLLLKVVNEDDREHSGHDEIKALGVERKKSTEQTAQRRARNPVAPVQHCHPQVEPAEVNLRRHVGGAGDGEGFVAQAKDEQRLLPACPGILAQQRQPIEQVARLNQQRHQKRLQRRKG